MLNLDSLAQLKELKSQITTQKVVLQGDVRGSQGRFGFVVTDDNQQFFLPPDEMAKVFPGDRIEFSENPGDKGKPQAVVEKILQSDFKQFTGRFEKKGKAQFVEPDVHNLNHWLYLPPDATEGANNDDWVRCEVTRHPFPSGKPQAKVVERIGKLDDPGFERAYAIQRFQLSHEWPETISSELALFGEDNIEAMAKDRSDLTHIPFVTIDSEHTRDMDDALWAEKTDDGWNLTVAIADPSAWFGINTNLDQEAARRGNTWYFVGRSLPMLPPELAHGLCSLLEGEKRLALICKMNISQTGDIKGFAYEEALIKSHGKLNYQQVSDFLAGDASVLPEALHTPVLTLNDATQALHQYRQAHRLVMEDRPDFQYNLNEAGKIVSIDRIERNRAQRLVEESMLATNLSTARYLKELGEGIFIQHAGFRPERLEDVLKIAEENNIEVKEDLSTLPGYIAFIKQVEKAESQHPLKTILSRFLIRSEFSHTPAQHTGMGFDCYTTFTSPIRKYNDLLVHRIIKSKLSQSPMPKLDDALIERLQQNLINGRSAVSIAENWLKQQFIKEKQGQTFRALITQVNPSGMTVQLVDTGIEGFVDLRKVEPRYSFDKNYLVISNKKATYQIDQEIDVVLTQVDLMKRSLKFSLPQ